MMTQKEKGERFRSLHATGEVLLLPNPWDGGSARLLAGLGYQALATSSGAAAAALGRRDGRINRAEALAHCRLIVEATELPVAADLENGYAHAPAEVAETIRQAAATGLVGGSIEDSTGDPAQPQYDIPTAVARIEAAVAAARALPFPFTLTARAENF
ncbi:MAG TPA: isocitrate lyase/phosphoenolpyruvate mutase family protein, partial [Verrucomicrobiae bacterium]